jgi:hypothetical protein
MNFNQSAILNEHRPKQNANYDMPAKPRRIRQLLAQNDTLKSLYSQVQQQQQLLAAVRKALPPNLARHCSAASLNGGVLNLFTDSPVWISKMRFLAPKLLSKLRSQHPGIASIAVRCEAPTKSISRRPKLPAARHSNAAARSVKDSAEGVSNPALRAALQRLAQALREK